MVIVVDGGYDDDGDNSDDGVMVIAVKIMLT